MNKRVILIIAVVCALAAAVCLVLFLPTEKQPFKSLSASDIVSVTVTLNPPNRTLEVHDTELLAALLQEFIIGKRDDSWRQCAGQWVNFTLTMTDGTQLEVAAANSFVIIDGKGYQCVYGPCETLNSYANSLLKFSEE